MDRSPWLRVYPQALSSPSAGLAFALVPWLSHLTSRLRRNSPDHNAKGTPSVVPQLAPWPTSDRLLACGFRISFTPRTGVLFTCPSRYSSTIGHRGVFSLGGWSPQLPTGFLASRRTQELYYDRHLSFAYRALTVCGPPFQGSSAAFAHRVRRSYNPDMQARRFRLRPFRSPLLRASRLISLPPGTEMFQFPGFASASQRMTGLAPRRVAPFGHLGITACVPLPRAYRSLPRPSSPLCAQASPTCHLSLDLP